MLSRRITRVAILLTIFAGSTRLVRAADLYVDNRNGNNIFDGRSPHQVDQFSGPFLTIRKALEHVRFGDTVHVANQGIPYTESLAIVGSRFQGGFRLEGNGAVITGAKPVPYGAWQHMGQDLWRFTPYRKAYYQLVSGDRAIAELAVARQATKLPVLPAGQWAAWHGAIYFHAASDQPVPPYDGQLQFAVEEAGITILDVDEVLIQDLELRHFRLDGIHVHDRSRHVILDRVRLIENGRAGLAVGGNSLVGIRDSEITGNRMTQVLNSERAQTEILSTQVSPAAETEIRRTGGTVLIDGQPLK